jgi:urease accessory protein
VVAVRDGARSVARVLRGTIPWQPRPLPADGARARVVLVQSCSTLLAGDQVSLDIRVGAGAVLELHELGATVAHHVRGGAPATHLVRVEVGNGGSLVWTAAPLVIAAGADVRRMIEINLTEGACVLARETIALGRHGEMPGRAIIGLDATIDGRPLLRERLDTGATHTLLSPFVAGASRVLDQALLLGREFADDSLALPLHGHGAVVRGLAPHAVEAARPVELLWPHWRALAVGGERAPSVGPPAAWSSSQGAPDRNDGRHEGSGAASCSSAGHAQSLPA